MSSRQVTEWMAAERLDPPAGQRIEVMLARLTALVYNRTRGKDESAKRAADFLPDYTSTEEQVERRKSERIRMKMEFAKLKRTLMADG